MKRTKGLIHIISGPGKGKTTSSVGLAVRALGHGLKVCYSFFNKKPDKYGYTEVNSLEKLGAVINGQVLEHPSFNKKVTQKIMSDRTRQTMKDFTVFINENEFDLLVMDEILISVRDSFIDEATLIEFIKNKPKDLELVMTGRGATEKLMELADYVNIIDSVKHPMNQGIGARKGIEF